MVCGESGALRDLDFALWEMRYTVLLQLSHWQLRFRGVWTVAPPPPAAQQLAQALATPPAPRLQL